MKSAADLDLLYRRCSARLAAHAADRLADAGANLGLVDDVTQEVWLWAAQQRRLPTWKGLSVMAGWTVEALVREQQDRPEIPAGMALPATRVLPSAPLPTIPVAPPAPAPAAIAA